jgi:5'-methylthioadenosine phosphorylase
MAFVTDFDCWHESEEQVTAELIIQNLMHNVATAKRVLRATVGELPPARTCPCGSALAKALVTRPRDVPPEARDRLDIILAKYIE